MNKENSGISSSSHSSTSEMISRRKILSRSRDALNINDEYNPYEEEDDIWFSKDKLYKDHIKEILEKWDQIDEDIWAKVVCMQKNRRIAKAYIRAPIVTINGSYIGFDGHRIGLNGFSCPIRDIKIEEIKTHIGSGAKIKIDDDGNILIKRIGKENVFVKVLQSMGRNANSVSEELLKNNGQLIADKSVKLFDMDKFVENIQNELKNSYPDRKLLESQCISVVAFVRDCRNIMELPIWIMIVNIVALDLLKSKLIAPAHPNCSRALMEPIADCLEYHKLRPSKTHVDHHKCSANKLTLRKWTALYGPLLPLLPPRDVERDEKIRKLREELEEVRVKIGNIESQYSIGKRLGPPSSSFSLKKSFSDYSILNLWPKRTTNAKQNNSSVQYDSGLDSDPYSEIKSAIYGYKC